MQRRDSMSNKEEKPFKPYIPPERIQPELSVTIKIGGIVRWISDRRMKKQGREEGSGILFCSGMIAGEGLVGILLAVFAVAGIDKSIDLSSSLNLGWAGGIALIVLLIAATMWFSKGARKEE